MHQSFPCVRSRKLQFVLNLSEVDKLCLTATTTEFLQSLFYCRPTLTVFSLFLFKKLPVVKGRLVCRSQFHLYFNTVPFFATCPSSLPYKNLSNCFQIFCCCCCFQLCFNLNFGKGVVRSGPYYMKPLHSPYQYAYSMANIYYWSCSACSCLNQSPWHPARLNGRG